MGMFSFLKDKDKDAAAETAAAAETPSGAVNDAAPTDSTFVRPAAWDTAETEPLNTSALSAPTTESTAADVGPLDPVNTAELQQPIIDAIKTVFDPEIPVDIYELGLIYDIIVDTNKKVRINMTLTSPACPSAQQIPSEVRWKVKAVPGVADAWVEIAWEPAWTKDRMSEAAKLQLGFF